MKIGTEENSGLSVKNKGIEYQGTTFDSVIDLARHLGISRSALQGRIDRNDPQSSWGRQSRRGGSVEHNKVVFPTLYDLAKKIAEDTGLSTQACARKLRESLEQGLDINEAVNNASENQNCTPIEYLGETYESLTALSKHLDLHIVTLRERILKQWPEEMWAAEKLPVQSWDFYNAIYNYKKLTRSCSVYVMELRRFKDFQKIGIAVSPTHRRDAEYGEEHYVNTFENRLHALIFESIILLRTQELANFPEELVPTHREERWHGITEVRQITWSKLFLVIKQLEDELEEEGFEEVALRYIPMSESQRRQLLEALNFIENDTEGQIDT